jgi:hypothetical protein
VPRPRGESDFPIRKPEPGWVPQVPVRNPRTCFVRVQTTRQSDDLLGFERFGERFQNNNLEEPENVGAYSDSGK